MNPLLKVDFYKTEHHRMMPAGTTKIYSNLTPRKSRFPGIDKIVVFGIQHFIKTYLIDDFDRNFFDRPWAEIKAEYSRHINVDLTHILDLHTYGRLPLEIKALPEGSRCPIGVPLLTITNTEPEMAWLVNYLETLLSCTLWQPITSATLAYEFRQLLNKYALETTGTTEEVQWQGHDFSMRGMSSVESAILSGMGHLLSFTGTDTIPAIYQLEESYGATGLIGASVPATEHSVQCMYGKEDEVGAFRRLIELYPSGILSVVSDTWDLWKVCTEYLPILKDDILAREGKLVIRPDSGDPVDIICGIDERVLHWEAPTSDTYSRYVGQEFPNGSHYIMGSETGWVRGPRQKGVIELLWDVFGGTVNEQGYKVLDPHIGAIYGDSINIERAREICDRLKAKGFASTNIVLGIGSYTYQYNTRDTFGFAVKATYGEVTTIPAHDYDSDFVTGNNPVIECREIFKDPITDDGTKKSKKGLLYVGWENDKQRNMIVVDQVGWEEERDGLLQTVFLDGALKNEQTLDQIRNRLT